jgi:hypothetical protein
MGNAAVQLCESWYYDMIKACHELHIAAHTGGLSGTIKLEGQRQQPMITNLERLKRCSQV